MHSRKTGSSHKVSNKHPEQIVALSRMVYQDGITAIESRIGTLQVTIESENRKVERLQRVQADGTGDPVRIIRALQVAEQIVATRLMR
jgi:hypothetical protein